MPYINPGIREFKRKVSREYPEIPMKYVDKKIRLMWFELFEVVAVSNRKTEKGLINMMLNTLVRQYVLDNASNEELREALQILTERRNTVK